jgi:tyrosine-protein phosphatase SIW14
VIDSRGADGRSTAEEKTVTASGMRYVSVPMTGLTPPSSEQITKILTILQDGSVGPVFVHCKRGADRTGVVIAVYRIQHDQWENSRALAEAMSRGYELVTVPAAELCAAVSTQASSGTTARSQS